MGLMLDVNTITPDLVTYTINEVLSNPKYKENAKITQALLSDHLVEPKDEFLYWVKYVIRTNGAKHLINDFAQEMSFVEFWSLDVYFVIFLTVTLVAIFTVSLVCYIVKFITSLLSRKKKRE